MAREVWLFWVFVCRVSGRLRNSTHERERYADPSVVKDNIQKRVINPDPVDEGTAELNEPAR
jgi:hypothetical protein